MSYGNTMIPYKTPFSLAVGAGLSALNIGNQWFTDFTHTNTHTFSRFVCVSYSTLIVISFPQ